MDSKSKKGVLIGVFSLLLITMLLLGLTYAYYRTRVIGNQSNEQSIVVQAESVKIEYKDGSASMNMTGLIEPSFSATKEFSVENTSGQSAYYSIVLEDINNTFKRTQDWQIILSKNGNEIISASDKVNISNGVQQILVARDEIINEKNNYVLTINYLNSEEDQSEDMGKTLSFKVTIKEESYTWDNAPVGSLLYALKTNQPNGTGETTPAIEASLATEKRILTTKDDYGTSYVYRGAVTNNYVTYSNMCWRIVRVQGDGSIKLALADDAHRCGTANGYNENDGLSAMVATTTFGPSTNLTYKNGDLPNYLKGWAENNYLDMSQLIETDWCNDVSIDSIQKTNEYLGGKADYNALSSAYHRLYTDKTGASLQCNFKGKEFNNSLRYKSKLGILTADEVAFAGAVMLSGKDEEVTQNYYLMTNSTDYGYWTMTLAYFYQSYVVEFDPNIVRDYTIIGVGKTGNMSAYIQFWDQSIGPQSNNLRPSVVLSPNVMLDTNVTGQTGEMNTPYVIG